EDVERFDSDSDGTGSDRERVTVMGNANKHALFFLPSLLLASTLLIAGCASVNPIPSGPTATPNVVVVTLTPTATPDRSKGATADLVIGPDVAYLSITMYGDFQCTVCLDVARSLAIIRTRYPADVRVVWRHFIQPSDDKARLAAQASEAAAAQGKFWEMHDQL